jgi:hypothetical protein
MLACAAAAGLGAGAARAASHREAPLISGEPRLDSTDFYMFRSYEPNRANFVTIIANYNPLQDPFGGPNYFALDPKAVYDINIDNVGDGQPHMTFRFQFNNKDEKIALDIGGESVEVPLINVGPIGVGGSTDNSNLNVRERYHVQLIRRDRTGTKSAPLTDTATGAEWFTKPVDNIGQKSLPDYAAYADNFNYTVKIPGCGRGRLFVGQRKDPFKIALGQTFDLINYAHPVGEQFNNSSHDDLIDKNVTALALEVPISCLTTGGDPVVGAWTAASEIIPTEGGNFKLTQKSRLANPLVNELLIGLDDKDGWGESEPAALDGTAFLKYVTNPTFPKLVEILFGTAAPTTFPRTDLEAVFLTGVPGVNKPKNLSVLADELRLNTSTPPTPKGSQNHLGVIGNDGGTNMDLAGYPNGRRPGDDIVDITLRAAMGRLISLGLFPGNAPSGNLDFTDGVLTDDSFFGDAFPYLKSPIAGSPGPQPH